MKDNKVLMGLSGGVDSAVGVYLLKKQGYDVAGGFMRNWDSIANNDISGNPSLNGVECPQETDYHDAESVATSLGITLYRHDFIEEYWNEVFSYFIKEYQEGRVPNPDVFCNRYIKFDAFYKFATSIGYKTIAMGHYAKRVEKNGKYYLVKAKDKNKDQTYFLSQISQAQLSTCLFPLGDIDKPEVRKIAKELNLSIALKKDSTGVCFIGERHFKEFLKNYLPAKEGNIVNILNDEVVGRHDGVLFYTIGQRKGLGIGGISGEKVDGFIVCKKDVKNNILYVTPRSDETPLLATSCLCSDQNFITDKPEENQKVGVKFRYRQEDKECYISFKENNSFVLTFAKPYKAICPGQAAVIYDGDICLGSGLIKEVYYKDKRID